jgi:hypothetical protein
MGAEVMIKGILPGIKEARVFEPEPAKVYLWERD